MDWAKIFFCLYLAVSNGASLNTNNSKKEILPKIEKLNGTISNSTKNAEETLEGSPSEAIHFKNPIIFRERVKDVSINKKYGTAQLKTKNDQSRSGADLNKEANGYSAVMSFTESAAPNIHSPWQIQPQLVHYREENVFERPVPIIESQSFINKPRMTSTQINYSPEGNLEGRHFSAEHGEHPEVYPNNDDRSYHEPEKNPGRGHTVHTETTHDYGRFLPVTYKSKIEMEAEALIKKQKAQNASSTERPEQNDRDNNQRVPQYYSTHQQPGNRYQQPVNSYQQPVNRYQQPGNRYQQPVNSYQQPVNRYQQPVNRYQQPVNSYQKPFNSYQQPVNRYRQPVNTAFFHKGGFETAYKFPEEHSDDQRNFHVPEKYPHHAYDQRQPVTSSEEGYSYGPRHPVTSTEAYKSQYSYSTERYPSLPHQGPPNAPRQYDLSTEKYSPTYAADDDEKSAPPYHETTPHSPRQYGTSVEQPPQYHDEKEKYLTSYNDNLNQPLPYTEPETKEFQRPYSNNPAIESPVSLSDPPQYSNPPVTDIPHSNEPYAKTVDDINGEKAYYSTFKSLMDLYKSIGFHFQPFSLDDMPIIQPPGFAMRNPFDTKFSVSSPLSVSSENFHPNSNVPKYSVNPDSHTPTVQSYDHTSRPYSDTSYSKVVNSPGGAYFRDQPERGKYSNYPEQVPYDSNRSPVVSTEHYDSPENTRPEFNSQVESPKEIFVSDEFGIKTYSSSKSVKDTPSDGIKVKGIRIKDYDSKSYFGNPPQKNVYSSAESDISSSASLPDFPNHSHSVVRENPYNGEDHHSGEARTTYRPRVYRQKVIVEDLNPTVNSEERTHDFHSSEKRNKFHSSKGIDSSRESSRDTFGPYPVSNEDQSKYSLPDLEMPTKPENKSPQTKSRSNRKSKTKQDNTKSEIRFNDQNERSNRKRKSGQNYGTTPFQGDSSYSQPEQRSKSGHTENQESRSSKRSGKRSSQRSPKKHKSNSRSQRDHMKAEGSTYHWGMERHKGTDGNFQYANVPGAKAFEFGYRMGGPEHTMERHHKTKGTHSKIKVNWENENGDTGDHYWEFNHDSREDDGEERKPKVKPKGESEE